MELQPLTLVLVIAVGFIVGGASFMVYGGRSLHQTRQFVGRSTAATGVVVGMVTREHRRRDSGGFGTARHWLRHPVVRFQTPEGRTIEFQSTVGTRPAIHQVGQRVGVFYDPRNPHDAKINSGCMLWALGLFFVALGCFFVAMGAAAGLVFLLVWRFAGRLPQ